jgi:hypothetical protein
MAFTSGCLDLQNAYLTLENRLIGFDESVVPLFPVRPRIGPSNSRRLRAC